jgi:hypothetical protein
MFIRIAHARQFDFEFRSVALELFGEFLGHGKGFKGIIALTFSSVKTFLEMGGVDFLFVNEHRKTMGLAFILFNLGFELICFLRKLACKCLEFLKLFLLAE